jgi:uncharacterized protein YjdB
MKCASQRRRTLLPFLLAVPVACSEVAVTAVDVARVEIEPAAPTVIAGQTVSLHATLRDGLGNALPGRSVAWSTSDPAIVGVDGEGVVVGRAVGTARVIAVAGGQQGESTVTVLRKPVAAVVIEPAALQLVVDESAALSVQPRAGDGEALADREVDWRTENPAVATVDNFGTVLAAGPGTTRILAVAEGVMGTSTVTVGPKPVASVQLAPAQLDLIQGEASALSVVLRATDGTILTGRSVSWRSEDGAVAQVDGSGVVTAVGAGGTRVIAAAEGVEGAASVNVSLRPVAAVSVSPPSATLSLGAAIQFHALLTAADGSVLPGRPVLWSSDASGIAHIEATGRVTAVGVGTATITATAEGVSGRATLVVQLVPVATVAVLPATLDLKPGDTGKLTAETRAADGTLLSGRVVTWASSDVAIATVDANGNVTGVAAGTATITATSEGQSGTAAVSVKTTLQPVAAVAVAPAAVTLKTGDVQQFTASLTAADGTPLTGRAVTWTSSDVAVLLIDAQGRSAALAPGTATVTATSEGVSGTAAVTVTAPPPPPAPVATVTVTPTGVRLVPGGTQQFTATARAGDGTVITGRAITWAAGSTSILTVNGQGLATAVAQGQTTVSATVDGVTGQVSVTVDPPPPPQAATVRVIPGFALVRRGTDVQLQAEVRAADGTLLQKTVTWTSSDSGIANVTSTGLVKTKRTGTVTITATVDGRSGTASIVILP